MNILADQNMPGVELAFNQYGQVRLCNGREITAQDVQDIDALLVRSVTAVNPSLLQHSDVQFVGSATIGIDHLDTGYLDKQQIGWASAPGCNARAVVEYVLACLAHLNRLDLDKVRVGIIGCGNVGNQLRQQMLALGANVRVYDPLLDQGMYPQLSELNEVLKSDIVCMHAPLTTSGEFPSHHLIGMDELKQLPAGALLLNAGRGATIDNHALLDYLQQGADIQLVLDVWEHEPHILHELLPHVAIATPHIAGYSIQGKIRGTLQVHEAFCQHFSLPPQTSLQLPAPEQPKLIAAGLANSILQVYQPKDDDNRFRKAAAENQVGWFDKLRKEYPVRHEFAGYSYHGVNDLDVAKAMQFQLPNQ